MLFNDGGYGHTKYIIGALNGETVAFIGNMSFERYVLLNRLKEIYGIEASEAFPIQVENVENEKPSFQEEYDGYDGFDGFDDIPVQVENVEDDDIPF